MFPATRAGLLSHVHIALQLLDADLPVRLRLDRDKLDGEFVVAEDEGLRSTGRLPVEIDRILVKRRQRIALVNALTVLVEDAGDVVDGDLGAVDRDLELFSFGHAEGLELHGDAQAGVAHILGHAEAAGPFEDGFGAVEVDAYGNRVMMAEPEKTVVDALDRPAYAGDILEIAAMLRRGQGQLDWDQLADYALRVESQALVQRLGYLADLLSVPLGTSARDRLLAGVGKSTPYLGRLSQWGTGGEYDATWHVMDNVPRRELLAEIEVL